MMKNILPYNLKNSATVLCRSTKTFRYGLEIISSLQGKTWAVSASETSYSKHSSEFKNEIQESTFNNCPCQLFQICSQNIYFL